MDFSFVDLCFMEFVAWFSHKYIMHGFCGRCTKIITKRTTSPGLNAMISFLFFMPSQSFLSSYGEKQGFGLGFLLHWVFLLYGLTYFMVHDIFIHQSFKLFRNSNSNTQRLTKSTQNTPQEYHKEEGECFGMLWVPIKYFK